LEPLPDGLRPDRCKVVLEFGRDDEIIAWVDPDRPDAWTQGAVSRFLDAEIHDGRVVIVRVGELPPVVLGNENAVQTFEARVLRDRDATPHHVLVRRPSAAPT
jgi:hypothetical protein